MYLLKYLPKDSHQWYQSNFRTLKELKRSIKENYYEEEYLNLIATIYNSKGEYIEYKQAGRKTFKKVNPDHV